MVQEDIPLWEGVRVVKWEGAAGHIVTQEAREMNTGARLTLSFFLGPSPGEEPHTVIR